MTIKQFIDYNSYCPVCNNKLSLFIQFTNIGAYHYQCTINNEMLFIKYKEKPFNDGNISLIIDDELKIKTYNIKDSIVLRQNDFFLFYLCDLNSFEISNTTDYNISPEKACYYRSSNFVGNTQITKEKDTYKVEPIIKTDPSINRFEIFSIIDRTDEAENIYMINIKDSKTSLFAHYQIPTSEQHNEDYMPNVFEKKYDGVIKLDLSDKNKLINKFQSWITMS